METFRIIRPIAPFNDPVLPRRSRFDPPMPHAQGRDGAFERRTPLRMRGMRHGKDHRIIRHHQMKRGQSADRPLQHSGNPVTGGAWMDFRVLHPGAQMNQADLVFPPMTPANRWQFPDVQLHPMASDRDRTPLPFFWAGAASSRRPSGCATRLPYWPWGSAPGVRAQSVWDHPADAPAVRQSRPGDTSPSPRAAHGCAVHQSDPWYPSGQPNAGWCGDARQTDAPGRISSFLHDTIVGFARVAPGSTPLLGDNALITCTQHSVNTPTRGALTYCSSTDTCYTRLALHSSESPG